MPRQTTFAKPNEIKREWRHVDATGKVLGRLASRIAILLMGKHRPEYTPHVDTGDYVIVTNASKVVMTGRKAEQKHKKNYSNHPSGLRVESYASLLKRRPQVVIEEAVRRMLPKNRLGRDMFRRLKVYAGPEHPHQAQQPVPIDYSMEKTPQGWKAFDVVVGGVSLVTNYREEFGNLVRESGVDGLIKALADKNRGTTKA